MEKSDYRHARLLRACRQWERYRRAAEKGDELAPPHLPPCEVGFPIVSIADWYRHYLCSRSQPRHPGYRNGGG